jgi:small subunit ribosomal protein S9
MTEENTNPAPDATPENLETPATPEPQAAEPAADPAPAPVETTVPAPAIDPADPAGMPTPEPAPVSADPAAATAPAPKSSGPSGHWWWGVGRRKTAVARVRIKPGSGKFIINDREVDHFFTEDRDRKDLATVLQKTSTQGKVDVFVNVRGGGYTGQSGAIVLGLGRALAKYDPTLESILRDNGFLTRDARKVERKKYGLAGARRRYQFSKR